MERMTNEEYLEYNGMKRPWCKCGNIEGDSVEVDISTAWQDVTCTECGASWSDLYDLRGYEVKYSPEKELLYDVCRALESLLDEWQRPSNEDAKKYLIMVDRDKVEKAKERLAVCKKVGAY